MNENLYQKLKEVASAAQLTCYGDIAPTVGLDMAKEEDRRKISGLLDDISTHEHLNGRPLLSAVVVRRQENIPGNGFFTMADRLGVIAGRDRDTFFNEELRKVHNYWRKT